MSQIELNVKNYHYLPHENGQQNQAQSRIMNQYQQNAEIYKFNRNQKDSSQVKSSLAPSENQDNGLDYIIYKDQVSKYISCKYPALPDNEAEKIIKPPTEDKYKYSLKQCSYPRNLTTRDIIGAVPGTLKSKVVQNFEKHHMMNDQIQDKQTNSQQDQSHEEDYDQNEYNSSPQRNQNTKQYHSIHSKTDVTPDKDKHPYKYGKKYVFNEDLNKRKVYDKSYIQEINQKLPDKIIHSPDLKKQNDDQESNFKQYYSKNESKTLGLESNQQYKITERQKSPLQQPYNLNNKKEELNQYLNNGSQNENQYEMNQKSKFENLSEDQIQRLINEYQKGYTSKLVNQYQAKNYDIINFYNKEDWRNNKNPNYVKIKSFPRTNVFTFLENGDANFNSAEKKIENRNKFPPQKLYSDQKQRLYLEEDFINNHMNIQNEKLPKIINTNKSFDSKQLNRHQKNQSIAHNRYENINNYSSNQYENYNLNDKKNILDYELNFQNNQKNEIIDSDKYLQPGALLSKKRSISVNNTLFKQPDDFHQRRQYQELLAAKGANIFNQRQNNNYQPRRPY
ncbi:hypothetical protein ABPG72_021094 [Tetrahymena utriculariae]